MNEFVGKFITLRAFPRGLMVKKLLGEGGFAFVYKAVNVETSQEVCLKRMIVGADSRAEKVARAEMAVFESLKGNPEIVEFLAGEMQGTGAAKECYMVTELCSGGHLFSAVQGRIKSGTPMAFPQACQILKQVAASVAVLHRQQVPLAHRDLKLENLLLASDGRCKLCDFGSCTAGALSVANSVDRASQEEAVEKTTSPAYRAPEMCDLWSVTQLDEAVDIWALGSVFFALLFHVLPFQDGGTLGVLGGNWRAALPKATGWGAFQAFEPLLDRMFIKEPSARASIQEVQACLEAASASRPLPPRPQVKLDAVAEAATREAQLAAKRAAAQQTKLGGQGYHAGRSSAGSGGDGARQALGANSAAARRLRGRQGPDAAPSNSGSAASPLTPAAAAAPPPVAAFDNAFSGSFGADFGAAPTAPAASNSFGDFGSTSSNGFGDFDGFGGGAPFATAAPAPTSAASAAANGSFDNFGASTFGGSFDSQPNAFGSNRGLLGDDSSSGTNSSSTFGEFGGFGGDFGASSQNQPPTSTNTTNATDAFGEGLGAPLSALSFDAKSPPATAPPPPPNNNLGLSPVSSSTSSALPPAGAFGSGRGDGNGGGTSFDSGRAGANWSEAWTGGSVAPPRPTHAPPMADAAAEDTKRVRWVVVPLGFKPGDSVDFPTDDGTGRTAAIVVPPGTKPGDKLKALVPPSPLKDPMAPGIAGGAATTPAATNAPTAMGGDSAARNLFDSGRGWSEAWGTAVPPPPPPSAPPPNNDPLAAPAAAVPAPSNSMGANSLFDSALAPTLSSSSSGFSQFDSGRSGSNDFSTLPPAQLHDPFGSQGAQAISPQQPLVPTPNAATPSASSSNDPFGGLVYTASGSSGSGGGAQQNWAHTRMSMQAAAAIGSLGSPGAVNHGPQQQTAHQKAPASDPFCDFGQVK